MTCIVQWVPLKPGADGLVLPELDDAIRYVMEKLDVEERQSAAITFDSGPPMKILEISRRYQHLSPTDAGSSEGSAG